MPLRLGPLTIPWPSKAAADDPYWDFFINTPAGDPRNSVVDLIRNAPEGMIFPVKGDIHTPEVTSSHIKELGRYIGADLVGIARLDEPAPADGVPYPFGVVCLLRADYDPRTSPGMGGQTPVQNGVYVTFVLSAYIRELGYRATAKNEANADQIAASAGMGTLNAAGRLVTPQYGDRVYVANIIRTDLPLIADK